MNRTPLIRSAFAIALAVAALHAEAKDGLEVVSLCHRTQREALDNQQYLATTVSARLGEWLEVGGVVTSADRERRGIASARRSSASESRRVWLKVEEIRQ